MKLKLISTLLFFWIPFLLNSQSEGGFGFRRFANTANLTATSVNNSDKSASRRAYVHSTGLYYFWNGTKWVEEFGYNRYFSVKTNLPFNSFDPYLSFVDLQNYYSGRVGIIRVDTTVLLPDDITVNSAVQFIGNGNLDISNTKEIVFNSYVEAEPSQYIFTGDGDYVFNQTSVSALYSNWFGANELNIDNTQQIQKSLDAAITSSIGSVKILGGQYSISKGLLIRNGSSTVTLSFSGSTNYDGDNGTTLYMTDTTNFAIGIQGGRNVHISNLYLSGKQNSFNPTVAQLVTIPESTFDNNLGRNTRYSPYSGVVIDPFKSGGAPADGGYPGFTSQYSNSHSTSSNIKISDVVIRYFISGVTISPSGSGGNGAEISVEDCVVDRNMFGIATGSGQNRDVQVTGTSVSLSKYAMVGSKFGAQIGTMPIFDNGQISSVKFIGEFNTTIGDCKISNMYGESIWAIGNWAGRGSALSFTNVEINFALDTETGVADAPSVLTCVDVPFVMEGGSLVYSNYRAVNIVAFTALFKGTLLNRPVQNLMNNGAFEDAVQYIGCKILGYNGTLGDYRQDQVVDVVNYTNTRNVNVLKNAKITYAENDGIVDAYSENSRNKVVYSQVSQNKQWTIILETKTVTIDTANRTGTFTTSFPGKYRVGDIIGFAASTRTPNGSATFTDLGFVSNISGGTITLSHVPMGVTTGGYQLELFEMPRFTGTWRGNIQAGTNKLIVTSKPITPGGDNASIRWPVGMRVYSKQATRTSTGIPRGTYVSSVVADTIYLSNTTDTTYTEIEFFNADLRATFYSLDGRYQLETDTLRSVSYQRGDEIIFLNHPYRRKAIITLGGFTPDIKIEFKNIYGADAGRPTPADIDTNLLYYAIDSTAYYIWDGSQWNEIGGNFVNIYIANGFQSDATRIFHIDSTQLFAMGQFPNFPSLALDGTDKGYYYNPANDVLRLINGNGVDGVVSRADIKSDNINLNVVDATGDFEGHLYVDYTGFENLAKDNNLSLNSSIAGTINNNKANLVMSANNTNGNSSIFSAIYDIGDTAKVVAMHREIDGNAYFTTAYLGTYDFSSFAFRSLTEGFGIQTAFLGGSNPSFDWFRVELEGGDTTTNAISLYEKYALSNSQPSTTLGDTSFHVWVGNGSTTVPMFLELDELCDMCGGSGGNGIYGGDGDIPTGGSQASMNNIGETVRFVMNTGNTTLREMLRFSTVENAFTRYFVFTSPVDSARFFRASSGRQYTFQTYGGTAFQMASDSILSRLADSLHIVEGSNQTKTTVRFIAGLTPGNIEKRVDGGAANNGDVLISNSDDWTVVPLSNYTMKVLQDFTTDVNNSGTGETDLYSYTIPASTLSLDGSKIDAVYGGTFNDITSTPRLRVYFAGNNIFDSGALTVSATGGWNVSTFLIRTGATTARVIVNVNTPGTSITTHSVQTDLTGQDFNIGNILKITATVTGAGGGSDDATAKLGTVMYIPKVY